METRTFESIVSIDEETAKASLHGIMDNLQKDGDFEIVSLETREIEGVGWIATLVVHMLDPEPENDDEDEGSGDKTQTKDQLNSQDESILLLHGHLGANDIREAPPANALPDMDNVPEPIMPDAGQPIQPLPSDDYDASMAGFDAPREDDIARAAEETVEDLTEEFREAESPDRPDNNSESLWEYAAIAEQSFERGEGVPPETILDLEELEDEEKRARFAAEMAERRAEGPVPDPAQSA